MNNRSFIRRAVSSIVYATIAFFLIIYFYNHASEIVQILKSIRFEWLTPLILLVILSGLFKAFLWAILMRVMGCHLPISYLLAVWHQSLAGKYIPGSIWMVAGRIYALQHAGVSTKIAGYSTGIEQIVSIGSAIFVVLLTPEVFELSQIPISVGLLFIPVIIIILFPHLLGEIMWKIGIRRLDLRIPSEPSLKVMVLYFAGHTAIWVISGICVLAMLRLFGSEPLGINILNASGIAAASFAIGYLCLLTPGGIGIREGVFTFLLSQYIPLSVAILIAMSGRLWGLMADGTGIFVAFLYFRLTKYVAVLKRGPQSH